MDKRLITIETDDEMKAWREASEYAMYSGYISISLINQTAFRSPDQDNWRFKFTFEFE